MIEILKRIPAYCPITHGIFPADCTDLGICEYIKECPMWKYLQNQTKTEKSGMYVHRACKLSGQELDMEKKAGGFCAHCGQSGTIFHVVGTIDYYQHVLNGVLYNVADGVETTPMADLWAREKELRARVKAARKGENWTAPEILTTPRKKGMSEVPPEAELAEETEAIAEVAEEALEEILEDIKEEEKEPDKVELEVPLEDSPDSSETVGNGSAPKSSKESGTETPLEAEPELTREELEARLAQLEAEAKK